MPSSAAKKSILIGSVLAALAVLLGAFGAHALKDITTDAAILDIFEKGVKYQMYHALAIIIVGVVMQQFGVTFKYIPRIFLTGIIFFSGSLYIITLLKTQLYEIPVAIGILTPIGGLCFVAGWLGFAWQLYKQK